MCVIARITNEDQPETQEDGLGLRDFKEHKLREKHGADLYSTQPSIHKRA